MSAAEEQQALFIIQETERQLSIAYSKSLTDMLAMPQVANWPGKYGAGLRRGIELCRDIYGTPTLGDLTVKEPKEGDIRDRIAEGIRAEWNDECCGHQNPEVCPACRVYERVLHLIDGGSE